MSSFVVTAPAALASASADLSELGSMIRAAHAAAAGATTQVVAAAEDEVSAAVATVFGSYGQQFQALQAQTTIFHDEFTQALSAAGGAYAAAEAAAASPLQSVEDTVLGVINTPTNLLLGRPLIGNGADGTAASPNGQPGGLVYGNGGNGFSQSANPGVAGGVPAGPPGSSATGARAGPAAMRCCLATAVSAGPAGPG